jgi:hypothetical protein
MGHFVVSGSNAVAVCGAFGGAFATGLIGSNKRYLPRTVRKDREGWRTLAPGLGYRALSGAFCLMAAFILYVAVHASSGQLGMAIAVTGFFLGSTLLIAHEVFVRNVRWNTVGVESRGAFGKVSIDWKSVKSGKYVLLLDMAVISDKKGHRIWISPFGGAALLWRYGQMRTGAFSATPGRAFRSRLQHQRRW